jgi:hypothetical protein
MLLFVHAIYLTGFQPRTTAPMVKLRRVFAVILIALGAVMLFAAPETLGGLLAIAAGVTIELVGIALEKRR